MSSLTRADCRGENDMQEYLDTNRAWWNERVPVHARSSFYDVQNFRDGGLTLMPLERRELGDVEGRSLLHLQCHFGLDTLSWARLGARVTGVDFSEKGIALARSLSAELGIEATFIHSDVYELPDMLSGKFDIVFTSYGVLTWLPDLRRWAKVIAHFLRPGGIFYIAEIHPFAWIFYDEEDAEELKVFYPYFHAAEPLRFEEEGSYAAPGAEVVHTVTYEWVHSLGDVVNSLISAGLRIEFLHEFPYACYEMFPFLVQDEQGWWRLRESDGAIPMTFSLKATK
jgi:SAM-dependent methyltransferase